ncbi:MAG: 16S rRNA (guanine(966)-N(2))-methyltransferase RsmD [Thermoleophilia bacterium]|nr:16S rRNA (guanine(966)-N(2))-methyltransferase RsmD [Thermoleophilia bacterium]
MRIVGGELGGRRISAPRGAATRPTPERAREALFNILGPLEGLDVLDLFAGSGALGLEALSRGARSATFVELGAPAVRALRENLDRLDLGGRARVLKLDWRRALRAEADGGRLYGVAVVDPPYAVTASIAPHLASILGPVLAPGARVVLEHSSAAPVDLLSGFGAVSVRRYGNTAISIGRTASSDV